MIKRYQSLLNSQHSLLEKTRVKILFACILTFLVMRLLLLVVHLLEHTDRPLYLLILLPLIWFVCLALFLYGRSWKTAANFFMIIVTVIVWASILSVKEGINILSTQYCLLALSCGYYLLGPKKGLFYSVINIFPLVTEVVLRNYFGYELPGRELLPNLFAYPILIVSHFLLLVYMHYLFFQTLVRADQRKETLKSELEAALAQSHLQTAAKSNFLVTMSHQLRTPLNVVQGVTNLLVTGPQLPQQEEYFKMLRFSTNNLMATIDHIVDFTSLEKGSIQLAAEPFSPGELASNVYQSFKLYAVEKQLKLTLDADQSLTDVQVSGDALRLTQILYHLVDNAVKFTESGQISIKLVATRIAWDRLALTFQVTDTGIGISKENLAKVLDPFVSTHAESSRQFHGTLGLAIASQLVHLHGRKLMIESQEGQGTSVSFNLDYPLLVANPLTVGSGSQAKRNLVGYHALVVDDEPLNILVMKRQLERWGFSVDSCVDGVQAVEHVKKNHYDLILMDINMPRMDGFEAAKLIRQIADPVKSAVPMLAVTASTEAVAEGLTQSADIDDYLLKPLKADELWHKIIYFLDATSFRFSTESNKSYARRIGG